MVAILDVSKGIQIVKIRIFAMKVNAILIKILFYLSHLMSGLNVNSRGRF